jgi:hypothetical protein
VTVYLRCLGAKAMAQREGGRRYDRNVAERVEHEQISVTGDDEIGAAGDGQLEKFVVLRITALAAGGGSAPIPVVPVATIGRLKSTHSRRS